MGIQYRHQWPWLALYTGPHFTLFWARRTFGAAYQSWPAQTMGTFCPGWVAGTAIALGRFEVSLEARSHYLYYQSSGASGSQSLGYGGAYLGVAYRR